MKKFKMKKEEMDTWLDSKDLNKGFFVVNVDEGNSPDADFNLKTTIEYYAWIKPLKMGDLSNIPEETSYFDYLIYHEYLELSDSLVTRVLNWNETGEDNEDVYNETMTALNEFHDSLTFYPVQEYSRIRESEFMENMDKYWTFDYGFFDLNATLKEQEAFANKIVDEIFETWEDNHDVDDEKDIFEPENWTDDWDWGIGSIVEYVIEKGGKINHI